jgi:hypothetical protein
MRPQQIPNRTFAASNANTLDVGKRHTSHLAEFSSVFESSQVSNS